MNLNGINPMNFKISFICPEQANEIIDNQDIKDLTDKLLDVFENEKCTQLQAIAAIFRFLHLNKEEK